MVWLNPAAFTLLALVPVLLVLHALRYRRRDVRVSTLFLWESVAREAQSSLGLRRLVQNLPLLLQILLVCLLAAALAEPALTGQAVPSRDVVRGARRQRQHADPYRAGNTLCAGQGTRPAGVAGIARRAPDGRHHCRPTAARGGVFQQRERPCCGRPSAT